jgi:hypothetical protein
MSRVAPVVGLVMLSTWAASGRMAAAGVASQASVPSATNESARTRASRGALDRGRRTKSYRIT